MAAGLSQVLAVVELGFHWRFRLSYIYTDSQSVLASSPFWDSWPYVRLCLSWVVLPDGGTGLSFIVLQSLSVFQLYFFFFGGFGAGIYGRMFEMSSHSTRPLDRRTPHDKQNCNCLHYNQNLVMSPGGGSIPTRTDGRTE
jgi:hypothetical protein